MHVLRDLAEYKKLTADRGKVMETLKNAPPVARPGGRNVGPSASTKDYSSAVRALKTDNSDEAFTNALRLQRKLKG